MSLPTENVQSEEHFYALFQEALDEGNQHAAETLIGHMRALEYYDLALAFENELKLQEWYE